MFGDDTSRGFGRADSMVVVVNWRAMSDDRSSRSRSGPRKGGGSSSGPRGRSGGRPDSGGRDGRSGSSGGRAGSGSSARSGGRPGRGDNDARGAGGRGAASRGPVGRDGRSGRPDRGGRDDRRDGRRSDGRRDQRGGRTDGGWVRPEPTNEAERRAAQVRANRGPRRTPITPEGEQAKIEGRTTEQWIDEGSLRDEAIAATNRVAHHRDESPHEIDPEVMAEIHSTLDPQRAARLSERLAKASAALDRERFDDARRMVTPLRKDLPQVAAVHEVHGLACYRLGRWQQAAESLELARKLKPDPSMLPVLADSYRGLRRWDDVESVWRDLREASPTHEVMSEGRIVAASALADRGELAEAIELMKKGEKPPKKVRDHHLRQWYVLGDLHDRAGDHLTAARWFREVAAHEPNFADVKSRLRSMGR